MTKFSIINLIIFIIALFLSNNLIAEETILPKPQPKIEELPKKETILPKTQPKTDEFEKEETSQVELLSNIGETLKEKMLLPKIKPKIDDVIELQAKQKKILLPKKKPEDQTKDQPELLETQKESDEEKIIAKIDDKKLIFPKKKPIIYQEHKEKHVATKSMYFSKRDFKLAKKIFSEIEKKRWTSAQDLATKASNRSIYKLVQWLYLLEPNNKANFYQYINFIKMYPDFPRLGRLEYLAEHKITSATVKEKRIIQWFEGKEPHSGYGKLMLGQSYLMEDEKEKGISLIKDGWTTAKLSKKLLMAVDKLLKKVR